MDRAPDSWVNVALSEVVAINPGIDKSRFSDDDELPFVPMPAVDAGTGRIDTSERRPFKKVKSGFTAFASGDVLFAKITPCMENGKMAVVPDLSKGVGFGTTEFHVLRPTKAIDARLLYYFVSSAAVRHEAQHNMTGAVGQKRVPKRFLEIKEFPLPPLNEQHRIVEKIETLFARIDKGEEALREVQQLLKRYRHSILKAAVTGELTRDWREANQHKLEPASDLLARILSTRRENWQGHGAYKEPLEADSDALPKLPRGWAWATMDQLGEILGGLTKNSKRSELPLKRPMLRVANVYQSRLNLEHIHQIGVTEKELARVLLEPLDILIVEGNGSKDQIGRMAIWRNEIPDAVHQNHLIKARLFEKQLADYTLAWFQSPGGRQVVEYVASSTSGLYTLSLSKIKQLTVPLPSLPEAHEIVAEVQELFSQADELEEHCAAELRRSTSLRQSILKSAFTGQLVPQDPADEPASELLTRIRDEREATTKDRPRRKARA